MSVKEITSKQEFDSIISSKSYVAVQAHATWCGPCKAIAPFFDKAAAANEELADKYAFVRFDTDEVPDLAQELGIRSIPAFFFFENGDKAHTVQGANPAALKKTIDDVAAKANGGGAAAAAAAPAEPAAAAPAAEKPAEAAAVAEEKKEPVVRV
jgi:thioredoxin 1